MKYGPPPSPLVPTALAALLLLGGCAATGPRPETPPPAGVPAGAEGPFGTLADFNRREALRLEQEGWPRQALDRWRVVASLRPQDAEARARVPALEQALSAAAAEHFRKGRAFLEKSSVKAARRELILALTADPDHAEALRYLKTQLEPRAATYTFREGDTMEDLAERTYGDPSFAVLLSRLNNIARFSQPEAGRKLTLPLLAGEMPERTVDAEAAEKKEAAEAADAESLAEQTEDYLVKSEEAPEDRELSMAQDHFEAGNFDEAIYIARLVPPGGERGEKAAHLVNASYLSLGRKLYREKQYVEALETLAQADQSSEDVRKLVAQVKKNQHDEAEEHYLAGIRFFIEQQLDDAIAEWEETLALDPGHLKARKDLDKALKLSEQLQKIR